VTAALTARVFLDWRAPQHWGRDERRCRRCGLGTHLRDESGRPCHKSCAEQEIAAELLGPSRNTERPLTLPKQKGTTR
jgi:hypothetical protein